MPPEGFQLGKPLPDVLHQLPRNKPPVIRDQGKGDVDGIIRFRCRNGTRFRPGPSGGVRGEEISSSRSGKPGTLPGSVYRPAVTVPAFSHVQLQAFDHSVRKRVPFPGRRHLSRRIRATSQKTSSVSPREILVVNAGEEKEVPLSSARGGKFSPKTRFSYSVW